jgi:hypothetical protein
VVLAAGAHESLVRLVLGGLVIWAWLVVQALMVGAWAWFRREDRERLDDSLSVQRLKRLTAQETMLGLIEQKGARIERVFEIMQAEQVRTELDNRERLEELKQDIVARVLANRLERLAADEEMRVWLTEWNEKAKKNMQEIKAACNEFKELAGSYVVSLESDDGEAN